MADSIAQPLVAVGIGNTSVQFALFDSPRAEGRLPVPTWHVSWASAELQRDPLEGVDLPKQISRVAIASVNKSGFDRTMRWIERRLPDVHVRELTNADFPIELGQREPHRVGTDRVAGATAVNVCRDPDRSAVFADAGTALTVNAIDKHGKFLGGAILPGIGVSLSTLSHNTDQLPELSFEQLLDAAARPSIGRDTEEAIRSGVFWSAVGAIRELTARMVEEMDGEPQRFTTGGFGEPLADALGADTQFVPHLVVSGIAIAAQPK